VAVTVATFRQSFPEFAGPDVYDGGLITAFIAMATSAFQNLLRWDPNVVDYGTGLFVAHHMVLQARASQTADAGGIPGTVQGVINNKSVDKVAVGYDVESVVLADAPFWNMTTYGIRFLQLTRMFGMGGAQLGIPCFVGTPTLFLGPL
jgi:Protein of unknown function (DUF4054)